MRKNINYLAETNHFMMKHFLLSLLILTGIPCYAHEYIHLLKDNKIWECVDKDGRTYQYETVGDTTIHNLSYKKLWLKRYCDDPASEFILVAHVREESQKVFLLKEGSTDEILLYDFGMGKGEQLCFPLEGSEDTEWIMEVSAKELINNRGCERYYILLNGGNRSLTDDTIEWVTRLYSWVEGVGMDSDPFRLVRGGNLRECYEDGSLIFDSHDFETPSFVGTSSLLLQEGKKWHYTYSNWATGKTYQYVEHLSGDSVVDGVWYKKYVDSQGNTLALLREEGGKVFVANAGSDSATEELLYDFTLAEGDEVATVGDREGYVVTEIGNVQVGNTSSKEYVFNYWHDDGTGRMIEHELTDIWVEGMGSAGGLLTPFASNLAGNFVTLDYIEMPDGSTFSFRDISGVEALVADKASSHAVYDLQGRRVQSDKGPRVCSLSKRSGERTTSQGNGLPKGIYIQNGRKFVVK